MERETPEEILARIRQDEDKQSHGKLKIFFGYAAGVGKTYAMLEAAQTAQAEGVDVVCGYVEPHQRPATMALLDGLTCLPVKTGLYHGIELQELDLDAALALKPQLILVDELAHTNAPFCRNQKRVQDVEELLRAGIDVYTSVNVQHIESLNDIVASITGITVQERIGDDVFDGAEQVELVDIEPDELIARLRDGKIYARPTAALASFFVRDNLTALREVALRRMADRVSRRENSSQVPIEEHILICLSSSPSNPKVIRTAARMAAAFGATFTALFVETPDFPKMSLPDHQRLDANTKLARSFGANIVTVYGEDVAWQIAEYVKQARISKVVLGRSTTKRGLFFVKPTFSERLTELVPQLDIYIIPDKMAGSYVLRAAGSKDGRPDPWRNLRDLGIVVASLGVCTVVGLICLAWQIEMENIVLIYILAALAPAMLTTGWRYSLLVSVGSVLVVNFFFSEPRYTFVVFDPGDLVTFAMLFLVSLITGFLTRKVHRQAELASHKAYRTEVLLETSSLLQQAEGKQEIYRALSRQLERLLDRPVVVYDGEVFQPQFYAHQLSESRLADYITADEQALAAWVYKNNKHAGAGTQTLPGAKCLYLAVRGNTAVLAVVGIALDGSTLGAFEYNVVLSILDGCAMALEKELQGRRRREVELAARQEQLRGNLLRGISHDLRTPLTTIAGNAELLKDEGENLQPAQKQELCQDIANDARWLTNMVENLLAVTRIKDGTMQIQLEPEMLADIIQEALAHIGRRREQYPLQVRLADDYMMVRADGRLLVQVFINLLDNAMKYTPVGTPLEISARQEAGRAIILVADQGPGISAVLREHIFDEFGTGKVHSTDSRRGLGIGLALCRAIVEAHGGRIAVRDNVPQGTIFEITLELEGAQRDE